MIRRFLTAAAAIELAAAAYTLFLGGFNWTLGPLRISAGGPFRPFVIGVVCAAAAVCLNDRDNGGQSWSRFGRWAHRLAVLAAFVTFVVGVTYGAGAAGASDTYGYVSQAHLWATGTVSTTEPLANIDPIVAPGAPPLGYTLVPPDTLVPISSPGLPILLAAASLIGGERMMHLVIPILGALIAWLTYKLGCIVSGPRAGLVAAVLLSWSPVFVEQLFLPMADLPATAWLLAAIVLALSGTRGSACLAGVAAAAAIVTRPNLLPLALAVMMFISWRRVSGARLFAFAASLAPGALAIALFNRALYGSPVRSGYGSLDALFRLEWIATNLSRYPRWLIDVHSIVILLGIAAPLLAARAVTSDSEDDGVASKRLRILLLAYCVLVVLCYIAYVPFEGWPYLRFWLPAIPVLFVLAAAVMLTAISRLPVAYRTATVLLFTCLLSAWYVDETQRLGVFLIQREEQRYPRIGDYLAHDLPRNAVILSGMHSGSLRLYGENRTLRWDQFGARDLDRVVALLERHGFAPFVLVEGDEERLFQNWFGGSQVFGKLDWPPSHEYFGHQHAKAYAFADRDREWTAARLRKPIPED